MHFLRRKLTCIEAEIITFTFVCLIYGMVELTYTLPCIAEDDNLFERFFYLLPGGPTKTPLSVTPKDEITPNTTQDNTEEDDAISRELKLQKKINSLQAQRGSLDKSAIRERRRMKKQEKKLQAKKKALTGKKENTSKDSKVKGKKNSKKQLVESSDQLLFGGLTTESQMKKRRKTITGLHGKNYKQLLVKLEKKEEEIKKLETVDKQAANEVLHEKKWKAALDRASGQKVKDNLELLKKALKRKEKLKDKRKKAWEERKENLEEKLKRKQARRERNIQTRKDSKKQTKLKKALKKGRIIPTKS